MRNISIVSGVFTVALQLDDPCTALRVSVSYAGSPRSLTNFFPADRRVETCKILINSLRKELLRAGLTASQRLDVFGHLVLAAVAGDDLNSLVFIDSGDPYGSLLKAIASEVPDLTVVVLSAIASRESAGEC